MILNICNMCKNQSKLCCKHYSFGEWNFIHFNRKCVLCMKLRTKTAEQECTPWIYKSILQQEKQLQYRFKHRLSQFTVDFYGDWKKRHKFSDSQKTSQYRFSRRTVQDSK